MVIKNVHQEIVNIGMKFKNTLTSIVLNRDADTPFPLASTMIGASPLLTAVTKKAVLFKPFAGTVTRRRRNNSTSANKIITKRLFFVYQIKLDKCVNY